MALFFLLCVYVGFVEMMLVFVLVLFGSRLLVVVVFGLVVVGG